MPALVPRKPVLIVEDNEDVQLALATFLESKGYATACADNGAEALALLRADAVDPCMILLDLNMPVMDGRQFRQVQRQDPRFADLPVVVYSGTADVKQTARTLDVPHYFQKPLNLDALVALVQRYC
jgi:CheY-like chemotaxis protein